MHRLTARLLLILLLVSVFAPVALAISTPAPHACCMRKAHDGDRQDSEFQPPPDCCQHSCCRPLTVSLWAHVQLSTNTRVIPASAPLPSGLGLIHRISGGNCSHFVRGPPQFSIA
jgi:hypothetical protein